MSRRMDNIKRLNAVFDGAQDMHLRTDADRIEMVDRVIDMMKNALPDNTFKILIDQVGMNQFIDRDPPGFFWHGTANGGGRYKDYVIEFSNNINGIWIQLH